jgi:hypothetical protein
MKTAFIILSLLISSGVNSSAGELKTKNIHGKVVDLVSSNPISGASITLDNGSYVLGTLSDDHGEFHLWKVPKDCKTLSVTIDGYQPQTVSIEHIKGSAHEGTLLIRMHGADQLKTLTELTPKSKKKKIKQ